MICGHCKDQNVNIAHVRACSTIEQRIRSIGASRPEPKPVTTLADADGMHLDIEGVYATHDEADNVTYYKVQRSQNGHAYAKVWTGSEWEYEGRKALYILRVEDRVTPEDAAQFGRVTGNCVFCTRLLTDERSIEVGYGPVCADKNGLPWG